LRRNPARNPGNRVVAKHNRLPRPGRDQNGGVTVMVPVPLK
jgi:hypothetical protein